MKTRTDFVTAYQKVLGILKSGEPYTLNKLSNEASLNFRTVKKILYVLESSQSSFSGKYLDVSNLKNLTVIKMKEKTGLTLFPEHIQSLIIKTSHYPTVSREEEVLVHLLLKNATNRNSTIDLLEDQTLKDLVEAEHVEKTNGQYFLTEDGKYIAKGALKLYPELEKISLEIPKQIVNVRPPLIPLAIRIAPNAIMIRKRLERRTR